MSKKKWCPICQKKTLFDLWKETEGCSFFNCAECGNSADEMKESPPPFDPCGSYWPVI